jgi:hypothetical protein
MSVLSLRTLVVLAGAAILLGCNRRESASNSNAVTVPTSNTQTSGPEVGASPEIRQALETVEGSLKSGSIDDAAAQLVKVRASGKTFSQQDAAAYRQAISEAYSRALEAAQKGIHEVKQLCRCSAPREIVKCLWQSDRNAISVSTLQKAKPSIPRGLSAQLTRAPNL